MTVVSFGTVCPYCRRRNELHRGNPDNCGPAPKPGAVSICWGCARLALFTEGFYGGLVLRKPDPDEAAELNAHPHVRAAVAAVLESATPRQAVSRFR